jgi:hypothetical protein
MYSRAAKVAAQEKKADDLKMLQKACGASDDAFWSGFEGKQEQRSAHAAVRERRKS